MEPTPETNPLESAPSPLSSRLVSILAIASGLSVANVHYLPPLLAQVAASYQVAPAQASLLFTATQLVAYPITAPINGVVINFQ